VLPRVSVDADDLVDATQASGGAPEEPALVGTSAP
jgi:hypothetical protein